MKTLPLLLLPLAAMAAEPAAPAVRLEPVDHDPAWRLSAGFRAAPGVKTSAAVDARAAAAAAGAVLRPSGHGGSSSSGAGSSTSAKTENLGFTTEGTTEADALEAAAFSPDRTRWDFDNGYIDLDDGAEPLREGETQNWHFDSADDFVDGAVRARTPFATTTTSRTRTTRTETSGQSSTRRSVSLREEWGELRGSSDETAAGLELRLDRTVWENADFGVDVGVGYAWYDDVDCFSVRGRAYSAVATERTATTTAPSGSRTTTTETTATTRESGTVVTSISQPELADPDDYVNADGSIGGAVEDVNAVDSGRTDPMPVLTVSPDRFSTSVERNPAETTTSSTTATSGSGAVGAPTTKTSSRTTRRTVDVRSDGTLSLQELRLGVRPFWKVAPWLSVRADLGLLATYSELETTTRLSVDGAPAATIRKDDDDWTLGGYAGLSLAAAATDRLELSVGAEARFPHRSLRFDDGVVSGKADLAEWSAFAAVGWRF